MAKNELRAHYRLVSRTLGELYQARVVAWNRWMETLPGAAKQAALREYLGVCGSVCAVRDVLVGIKREMNHAR